MIPIIYEDKYILVVHKPAGMPVTKDRSKDPDLVSAVEADKGYENLQLINRLDRPVSGIVLMAKDKNTQAGMMKQIQERSVSKTYLAWVDARVEQGEKVTLVDYMTKSAKAVALIVPPNTPKAKKASLSYEVLEVNQTDAGEMSLLKIDLHTGRFHQIRAQLAHHKMPIIGDTKYNESAKEKEGWQRIQLVAWQYSLVHPITKKKMTFTIEETGLKL